MFNTKSTKLKVQNIIYNGHDDSRTETNIIVNPPEFQYAPNAIRTYSYTHAHTLATLSRSLAHKR